MAASDPVADMLSKIQNAAKVGHEKVDVSISKMKLEIVKILKTEGYIKNFKKITDDNGHSVIRIFLKYDDVNESVIHGMKKISTPGRRVYSGYRDLPRVYNGFGTLIISTSTGVTTGKKASEKMVGGSKVGKLPVAIPAGVTVSVTDNVVTVKGSKGELKQNFNSLVKVEVKGNEVIVSPSNESKDSSAAHGLYRNLINNMVTGVSSGFSKSLIITGVGYRAEVRGKELVMNLGYSNEFIAIIPEGLTVVADQNGRITISGIDKQRVGEFSAQIRKLRGPEPYKGKGIRYETEVIRRKVGKTGVK